MNKVAQYLNQHIVGDVIIDESIRSRLAVDNSPLAIMPEMVIYPRNTNDIRKVLRFAWQLAKKGHQLPIVPRGAGQDTTGGAIGSGVMIDTTAYMDRQFEVDVKQQLIRLQPGVRVGALQDTLAVQGLTIQRLESVERSATVGGTVAGGLYDEANEWIDQLEVVLANGDILQTKRFSKRELNRKKGEQGFEADIYRGIDGLIDEKKALIESIDEKNAAGYSAIKHVKRKDGSFDLAPLIASSQGTLGVISEIIAQASVAPEGRAVLVAAFEDAAQARDALDGIGKNSPSILEYYDETVLTRMKQSGKQLSFLNENDTSRVLLVAYFDGSQRSNSKRSKKLQKYFTQKGATVAATDNLAESELAIVVSFLSTPFYFASRDQATIPIADGIYVPLERFEQFKEGLAILAGKHHIELPLYGRPLDGIWYVKPALKLKTVGGKQAALKLTDEIATLLTSCGGYLNGESAEGRMQSFSAHKRFDEDITQLYADIKQIFDPNGILNTGVKQTNEVRDLVKNLRSEYTAH